MKDDPELALEQDFYAAAMQAIDKHKLGRTLEETGFVPTSALLKHMGSSLEQKYQPLDGIQGSRLE